MKLNLSHPFDPATHFHFFKILNYSLQKECWTDKVLKSIKEDDHLKIYTYD